MINVPFPPIIPVAFSPEHLSELIEALEAVPKDVNYLCSWLHDCEQDSSFKLRISATISCTTWIDEMLGGNNNFLNWMCIMLGRNNPSLNHWVGRAVGYTPRSSDKHMLAYRLAWAQHLLNYLKSQV